MIDEETSPLLGGSEGQSNNGTEDDRIRSDWMKKIRERWPIVRILFVTLLMYICSVSTFPAQIQLTRSLACAQYYEQHPPSLITKSLKSFKMQREQPIDLCDIDQVERQTASTLSLIQTFASLSATFSLFFLQPKLRKWGKKTIFLASIAILLFDRLPPLFLPIGYPFRSIEEPMKISSVTSFRLYVGLSMIGNLMGSELIGSLCVRLFITEASSAGNKTEGLLGVAQMNIISLTIGPALTAWLGTLIPFSSSNLVKFLTSFRHSQNEQPTLPAPLNHGPIPPTSPAIKAENVAPYLISCITILLTLITAYILLPADHREENTNQHNEDHLNSKSKGREPFYWRLWPRKDIDGKRDWRIAKIVLVTMCHLGCAYTLNIYVVYFGHAFHWGPESVSLILSWLGIARLFTLFIVTPFMIAYFERKVRKPVPIQQLTLKEIKAIAKEAPADEPPIDSDSEIRPRNSYGSIREEQEGATSHTIRGAVITWRALVDRKMLKTAWSFDIFGWILCAFFTAFHSASLLLLSAAVVAFGAPALAVRQSVDLVIVGDVLARTNEFHTQRIQREETENEEQMSSFPTFSQQTRSKDIQADELYFSLSSFFESLITFLSPLWSTLIYNRTLTTFPAANWLMAVGLYSIAMIVHFSMPLHVRSK